MVYRAAWIIKGAFTRPPVGDEDVHAIAVVLKIAGEKQVKFAIGNQAVRGIQFRAPGGRPIGYSVVAIAGVDGLGAQRAAVGGRKRSIHVLSTHAINTSEGTRKQHGGQGKSFGSGESHKFFVG